MSISKYFESVNRKVSTETLYQYIEHITASLIINKAVRYDVRSKRLLTRSDKYYLADMGFSATKNSGFKTEIGALIENIVFNTEQFSFCTDTHPNKSYSSTFHEGQHFDCIVRLKRCA